jgi:hypothetical protein
VGAASFVPSFALSRAERRKILSEIFTASGLFNSFRYIDDIFFVWPQIECDISKFHAHLNSQNNSIEFTNELEKMVKYHFMMFSSQELQDALQPRYIDM